MRPLLLFLFLLSTATFAQSPQVNDFQSGKLFVKFNDHHAVDELLFENDSFFENGSLAKELNATVSTSRITGFYKAFRYPDISLQHVFILETEGGNESLFLREFSALDDVEYVELIPNYYTSYTPNDLQSAQYALSITTAENAWDIEQGDPNVAIAIVDDGFRMDHQDLAPAIYTNTGEIPANGIDDDGNGYIDDVTGWDAADNDNDPNPGFFSNSQWTHGTHVAGIAAASTDDGTGIASIGFNCKFIPVKSTNVGTGAVTHAYAGVDYALSTDARIISMSWGGNGYSNTYQLLYNAAYNAGKICVAAAGNSNTNIPMYPASYNHVISVGSTNSSDVRSGFSNYGATIDVMAPGSSILSCVAGGTNTYAQFSGTSMACPFVSGLCALMLSANPAFTPDELEFCLESTCDNIYPLNPNYTGQLGAGRVNAEQALICASQLTALFAGAPTAICPGQQVQFTDQSLQNPTSWNWTFPGGTPASSTAQNPLITYNTPGTYNVTLVVSDGTNTDNLTLNGYITVAYPTATISGNAIITQGMSTFLTINFTGDPPYDFTVSDGTTTYPFTGVNANPYSFQVTPNATATYALTAFSTANCSGTMAGQATVTVLPAPESFECYYTNIYGDALDQWFAGNIVSPIDHSIYLGGTHNNTNGLLAHMNPNGSLDWVKSYGATGKASSFVERAPNGDVVMAFASPDQEDYIIGRFDPQGNVVWMRLFDKGIDRQPRLVRSLGDSYIVAGWTTPSGSSDNMLLMRIDANGNILWSKSYNDVDDQLSDIISDGNGGCYATGGLHALANINFYIIHVDADGNTIAKKEFDYSSDRDDAPRLGLTPDGGLAVVGQTKINPTGLDIFITKLDASLQEEWSFADSFSTNADDANDMEVDGAGNIYAVVREHLGGSNYQVYVYKFTPSGTNIWVKKILGTSSLQLTYNSVGGSNAMVGTSRVMSGSTIFGGLDGLVFHSDTALSECVTEVVTRNLQPISWTISDWTVTINNTTITGTPITTTVTDLVYDTEVICEQPCLDTCEVVTDFTASDLLICGPQTVNFTNLSTGATDYSWLVDGVEFATTFNASYTFNSPGNYSITLIASDTCQDVQTLVVVADFIDYTITPDTVICSKDSVQLNVTGGQTYSWQPTTGLSNPNIADPVVSPAATTTYIVTISTDECSTTASVTVTVDQNCCVTHPDVSYDPTLCEGELLVIQNNTNATGQATYEWDFAPDFSPASFTGPNPPNATPLNQGLLHFMLTVTDDCGTFIDTFAVGVYSNPIADAGPDTVICNATPVEIGSDPLSYHDYLWTPTTGLSDSSLANPIADVTESMEYIVRITDQISGCEDVDTVRVEFFAEANLGPDTVMCFGDTVWLRLDYLTDLIQPVWSDGTTGQELVVVDSGLYWVQVDGLCGMFTSEIRVDAYDCACEVRVPNVFNPNGSGINDLYRPEFVCPVAEYEFTIYNRWGLKIFHSTDPLEYWSGECKKVDCSGGTYYWVLTYTDVFDNKEELTGFVMLLR